MVYFVAFVNDIICVIYIRDRMFIGLGSFSETTLTVKSKPTEPLHGCSLLVNPFSEGIEFRF